VSITYFKIKNPYLATVSLKRFNLRVYGICYCDKNHIIISEEAIGDFSFTKFPGGGVHLGEGIKDALIREFKEEGNVKITDISHFYTTDFFQESAFSSEDQIISIYYTCKAKIDWATYKTQQVTHKKPHHIEIKKISISDISVDNLTFPIDKVVFKMLKENNFKI
jgi:8-oxo-dGTP diphosphatase